MSASFKMAARLLIAIGLAVGGIGAMVSWGRLPQDMNNYATPQEWRQAVYVLEPNDFPGWAP